MRIVPGGQPAAPLSACQVKIGLRSFALKGMPVHGIHPEVFFTHSEIDTANGIVCHDAETDAAGDAGKQDNHRKEVEVLLTYFGSCLNSAFTA